jgi:hypothetical protein
MSVYTLGVSDRNIFNLPRALEGIDINTQNAYQATIAGYQAGVNVKGQYTTLFGYYTGYGNTEGAQNNALGAYALFGAVAGNNNVAIGTNAGYSLLNGSMNLLLGNNVGFYLTGNRNIMLGFNNTFDQTLPLSHCNISIGVSTTAIGHRNIIIGSETYGQCLTGSILIGNNVNNISSNINIIIGPTIENRGERVLIINNRHSSNNQFMRNAESDYMNINDYIVVQTNSSNESVMTLSNQVMVVNTSNLEMNFGNGRFEVGSVIRFAGSFGQLLIDSNILLGQTVTSNSPYLLLSSNGNIFGGSNSLYTAFQGCNVNMILNSNIISLSNTSNLLYFDSNSILLGGLDNKYIYVYGSNNGFTLSNGGAFFESGVVVYRDTILSNNLVVNKTSSFMDFVDIYNDTVFHSNAQFDQDIYYNPNTVIYMNGNVVTSNEGVYYITGDGETRVEQPIQLSEVFVNDKISYCNVRQGHVNWDNITDREVQELYGSTIIQKNMFVGGMVYALGLNVADRLVLQSSNTQWSQYVEVSSNANPGLVFKSGTGTTIKIGDDFTTEILNFTGKHRCKLEGVDYWKGLIGKIVIANGQYCSLDNSTEITIDEAIPVIEVSQKAFDKRAFGVISGIEDACDKRVYRIGNLQFENTKGDIDDIKVIVNSVGEGGIWVCNENGGFKNGDLITTSSIEGFGMNQQCDYVTSSTVGKITCDCDFLRTDCEEILVCGKIVKIMFVGCIYKF